jgi:hypothetical protein
LNQEEATNKIGNNTQNKNTDTLSVDTLMKEVQDFKKTKNEKTLDKNVLSLLKNDNKEISINNNLFNDIESIDEGILNMNFLFMKNLHEKLTNFFNNDNLENIFLTNLLITIISVPCFNFDQDLVQSTAVILDDDPNYYWTGRLTVTGQFGNKDYSSITIGYNLYPYKTPIGSTSNIWWKWNELFSNTILYGTFSVNGRKFRNIINDNSMDITAVFTTTYQMDIYPYDGTEEAQYKLCYENLDMHDKQHLITGSNNVTLHSGNNYFLFVGDGNVTVEYERGKTL